MTSAGGARRPSSSRLVAAEVPRPQPPPPRRILHCDMDCFYAAVHMRDDASLRGKPVVIGGRPEKRGVVAAASYEVRAFGVRSAMPMSRAVRLCPEAIILRPEFPRYREESAKVFEIFRAFTPVVQPVSIDEAFLDVTDHLGDHGSATAIARAIRARIAAERRLTVSVGVGPNRLVAKIASDHRKPDGMTVVPPRRVEAFLGGLPVRKLPGVGPATERVLTEELGLHRVADLRTVHPTHLAERLGRYGESLFRYAWGIDERPVRTELERKSLSSESTYAEDLVEIEQIRERLDGLARDVAEGLGRKGLAAATINIKVRYEDFTTVTRARTVATPVTDFESVSRLARELLAKTAAGKRPVRLLGVGAAKLVEADGAQGPRQLGLLG